MCRIEAGMNTRVTISHRPRQGCRAPVRPPAHATRSRGTGKKKCQKLRVAPARHRRIFIPIRFIPFQPHCQINNNNNNNKRTSTFVSNLGSVADSFFLQRSGLATKQSPALTVIRRIHPGPVETRGGGSQPPGMGLESSCVRWSPPDRSTGVYPRRRVRPVNSSASAPESRPPGPDWPCPC